LLAEAKDVNICEQLVARLPLYIGCNWLSGTASFLWSYSVNQKKSCSYRTQTHQHVWKEATAPCPGLT